MHDLVIIGCGGFGRESADVVDAINRSAPTWNLLGFVDDDPSAENVARVRRRGAALLGGLEAFSSRGRGVHYAIGIGDAPTRERVASVAEAAGMVPATLVHPWAAIGADADIGEGVVVCAYAQIGSDVSIGRHVHLDRASQIGHDCAVEDFVTVHPAAVVSGGCVLGPGAELGTGSTILPGTAVGAHAVVGAAACVVKDVPPGVTVKGVPAG
ncbi:NeuD/PglB/VioB family sugar acetyltransferase [Aeromicrobium chenweiae]|uniref:Sugar acetyltransferase n=1 Tax=Aeromicrobium chenweiae TaxID=2079793 RepID=A0A2S0WIN3_9ACTN|nr:NeuD/PglB/VioB family sugar acetyltransferase [Aeromicrobium chenweiae]AWB91198.1 sugar acetyltransferase [Aeromicrobium chenweiae]TGN31716.1 sugar acetyltransferase [Aeromicrobium chenweiae]